MLPGKLNPPSNFNPLPIEAGGTGRTTAASARQALGVPSDASQISFTPNGVGAVVRDLEIVLSAVARSGDYDTLGNFNAAVALLTETFAAKAFSGPLTGNVTGNVSGNLTGSVTGNVTGNVSGSSGSCTGNSATATLATDISRPISASFESSEQTLTLATVITVAHGLGRTPSLTRGYLRCKTAELGHSIGDEIPVDQPYSEVNNRQIEVFANSTNIGFVMGVNIPPISNRTGGSIGVGALITLANWKMVLRAW